jgi:hypothetical protein
VTPRPTLSGPGDLTGFPTVRPPDWLYRICRGGNRIWWFSCEGSGRFDLHPREGTCYFATDLYAAIREASRLGPVTPQWVAERDACRVSPPDPRVRLAATTHKAAGAHGLTQELVTVVPYDLPRQWAAAFRALGLEGIRHQLRHDPRARASGVALFGQAGASSMQDGERTRLAAAEVRSASVQVIEPPDSAVLTVLP